jgi:hypothetical protein
MGLQLPGTKSVCVVRPASQRDAAACEGIDLDAVEASLPPSVVAYSVQNTADSDMGMQVVRMGKPKQELNDEAMTVLVGGARKGIAKVAPGATTGGLTKGADFDKVKTSDGGTAFRFLQVLPDGANDGYDRILSYVAVSGESLYTLRLELPAALLAQAVPASEKLVAAMRLTAAPPAAAPQPAASAPTPPKK